MNPSDCSRIGVAIGFLVEHEIERPSFERVAAAAGLSEFHFQRLFQRWTGVSPRQLLAYLTLERAREMVRSRRSLLEASGESLRGRHRGQRPSLPRRRAHAPLPRRRRDRAHRPRCDRRGARETGPLTRISRPIYPR